MLVVNYNEDDEYVNGVIADKDCWPWIIVGIIIAVSICVIISVIVVLYCRYV